MGEPAGGGVGQLARDRRGLERRQARPEIGGDRLAVVRRPLGVEGGEQRDGLGDHSAVLEPRQVAAIEVIAAADHDLDAAVRRGRRGAKPASARAAVAASSTRNCSGSPPATVRGMIPCSAASNAIGESR